MNVASRIAAVLNEGMSKQDIQSALGGILAPHEEKWKAEIHDLHKSNAEHRLKAFNAFWSTKDKSYKPDVYDREKHPPTAHIRHPHNSPEAFAEHPRYGDQILAAKRGTATIDHDGVKAAADAHYTEIRDSFIARGAEKISHVAGTRGVQRVEGDIHHHRALEGSITAHLDDKNNVTLDAAIKNNYRYGENAANRDFTAYHQYPFTVRHATVDGQHRTGVGADELATQWGGAPAKEVEAGRKKTNREAKAAWTTRKDGLEKDVRSWREIHDTVSDHAKKSEAAVIARDPSHPKHAKMKKASDDAFDKFLSWQHPANQAVLRANQTTLEQEHSTPPPLGDFASSLYPAAKHAKRLGLAKWPEPAEAKEKLNAIRAELEAHKAAKPKAE